MSKKTKYRWTQNNLEAVVSAKDFGPWLESLPDRNPETIVQAASKRNSPAHRLFIWSDARAALEQRLTRARVLLGSFVIEVEVTIPKRAPRMIEVPFVTRSAPGSYEITVEAMKEPDKRRFILQEALKELSRLRRRYAHLSELAVVFTALDKVETSVAKKRRA